MGGLIDDNPESVLDEAVQQFIDERLQSREPDIDEFVKQYPELEQKIREKILNLEKIDTLFHSLVRADDTEFAAAATRHDITGRKIGSFEIVEMIGRGGMGVVYLARDTKLKRSVAIKSMPAGLASDTTAQMRFRREAELLASMNHPNIAVIYEIIEQDEGAGYLILEYVPGQTLAERIVGQPLKLKEALTIGRQIAEALSAAHEKGVVHRDLKPGNIKVTPDDRVKVLDFGLAKTIARRDANRSTAITHPGRVIGTPAYMSPEQARGKSTDHRTDIWSFGCIMYQMLTGHLPFEGETATDTLARIIEREPDWQMLAQDTPGNIRTLLQRCLEKDPDRRLGDIADAANEISETMSISATALPTVMTIKQRKVAMIVGAAIIIFLSGVAVWFTLTKQAQPSSKLIRLVVLPFQNLGSANEEDYSSAIAAEIIGRLVGLRGLAVSSEEIAENRAMLLGKESGIDYVLKGTVQCVQLADPNSQEMRIRPQLIRISDGQYVWAEPYDKDMSQIYRIPSEVAEQVVHAMNITLLDSERQAIMSVPTENEEAYAYYIRGNDYCKQSEAFFESDLKLAIGRYEKAIELDPNFALAHAQLSRAHTLMFKHGYDRSQERLDKSCRHVDKALELDPGLPEAHLALGNYYYHGHKDYDRALGEADIVRRIQPNNNELLAFIGAVQRRQGRFVEALANLKKASEINSLSSTIANGVAVTLMFLRKYSDAEPYFNRAIELAPDKPLAYRWKAWQYLLWEGDTNKARAVLEEASQIDHLKTHRDIVNPLVSIDIIDRDYEEALNRLSARLKDVNGVSSSTALRLARIYRYMAKEELAKKYYDHARGILESSTKEHPERAGFHSALGIAYAGLGRKEDAIREGKLAVEILPVSKEALAGPGIVETLAGIYVMVGEYDAAIDELTSLLSIPSALSVHLLRLDPAWDPLRNHPRFKKLLETEK